MKLFLNFLGEKAQASSLKFAIPAAETSFGKIFIEATGLNFNEYQNLSEVEKQQLKPILANDLEIKLLFNRFIASRQIKVFDKIIKTTSSNFSSMFSQTVGSVSSTQHLGNLPREARTLSYPETLGRKTSNY